MCELFAVNAARPVEVAPYLEEFFSHSKKHKDGWGITWRLGSTLADAVADDKLPDGQRVTVLAAAAQQQAYAQRSDQQACYTLHPIASLSRRQ